MRKTILTLMMVLMAAFAVQEVQAAPAKPVKQAVQFKSDSVMAVATDGVEKVREKINDALDDTLTTGNVGSIGIGCGDAEMTPEDMKEISAQWATTFKHVSYASIAGLLALVLLVLWFRYLNRRNKFRVMERAIENNYPLNELSFNEAKRSAIYVQQPIVTATPPPFNGAPAQQPGQVPVGTPIAGQTPDNPVVMTDMVNWRALMPAIRLLGWGLFVLLFGLLVVGDGGKDPITIFGMLLMFLGLGKGFILYKEQKALQEAWKRAGQTSPRTQMREGIPVPPPMDEDYKADDDNNPYQPY